mgnify:CR=1 FL=1
MFTRHNFFPAVPSFRLAVWAPRYRQCRTAPALSSRAFYHLPLSTGFWQNATLARFAALYPAMISKLPLLLCLACLSLPALAEPVKLARDAALSPDGKTLVFTWRDDVWSMPVSGGRARRLTEHPAEDSAPAFSPDGKQLAFISTRGLEAGSYHARARRRGTPGHPPHRRL